MYKSVFYVATVMVMIGCGVNSKPNVIKKVLEEDSTIMENAREVPKQNILSNEQEKIVARHNYYRNLVSVPILTWDKELATHAQTWANYLSEHITTVERDNRTSPHAKEYQIDKHSEDEYAEGENIAWSTKHIGYVSPAVIDTTLEYTYSPKNGEQDLLEVEGSIDAWASEAYYYANNTKNKIVGHYTQIVWKNTTKIGCGKALSKDDTYFNGQENVKIEWVVCRYSTPGNIIGQSPY